MALMVVLVLTSSCWHKNGAWRPPCDEPYLAKTVASPFFCQIWLHRSDPFAVAFFLFPGHGRHDLMGSIMQFCLLRIHDGLCGWLVEVKSYRACSCDDPGVLFQEVSYSYLKNANDKVVPLECICFLIYITFKWAAFSEVSDHAVHVVTVNIFFPWVTMLMLQEFGANESNHSKSHDFASSVS
ncbi:hypothetical protein EJB05_41733 [Eragrostis curvula]|uniref:Uncharacterized protein n=1 Tax=Eragrostis curvula TaxID=38414 RepID=A0A5J9TAJ8_9POAL|nr:hypothetical protein EJB05_41733 [Eragrostis curvula]